MMSNNFDTALAQRDWRVEKSRRLRAEAEIERLLERAQRAEAGHTYCAFCGAEYPQDTPRHGDGALAEHIMVCPEHPMRDTERERDAAVVLFEDWTNERAAEKEEIIANLRAALQAALTPLEAAADALVPPGARAEEAAALVEEALVAIREEVE